MHPRAIGSAQILPALVLCLSYVVAHRNPLPVVSEEIIAFVRLFPAIHNDGSFNLGVGTKCGLPIAIARRRYGNVIPTPFAMWCVSPQAQALLRLASATL